MIASLMALALAAGPVSVQFDGTLKQGLTTIAERGGLNVIVVGDLSEPAQIHLTDLSAEEALEAVAKVYQLEVTRQGKLFILRRSAAPVASPVPAVPVPVVAVPPTADPSEAVKNLQNLAERMEKGSEEIDRLLEENEAAAEEKAEAAAGRDEVKSNGAVSTGPVVVASGQSVKEAVAFGAPIIVESGGRVRGDAVAFGGDVVLRDGAIIEGDAVSFGGKVTREGKAVVKGEEVSLGSEGIAAAMATQALKPKATTDEVEEQSHGLTLASFLMNFVVFFVFGFLFMVFAPQRMKGLEAAVRTQPVASGLVGFLALVALVPVSLFLIVTLIGIPVAGLLWALLALVIPMGLAAIANALGGMMPLGRVRRTQALVLAVGLLLLWAVAQVPVLGPMLVSLAVCVSLGAVLRTRLGAPPKGLPVTDSVQQLGVR